MKIKISLPRDTAVKTGKFFNDITEAVNRGEKFSWSNDYNTAILQLSTSSFFTIDDVKSIIESGGTVEGFLLTLQMPKNKYLYESIPQGLADDLGINTILTDETNPENVTLLNLPTYSDIFPVLLNNNFPASMDLIDTEYSNDPNNSNILINAAASYLSRIVEAGIIIKNLSGIKDIVIK